MVRTAASAMSVAFAAIAFSLPSPAQTAIESQHTIAAGTPSTSQPQIFSSVGIDQHLNTQVPLDLRFKDENGQPVKLGDYFGKRPVILTLVYYQCPMLCTQVLNGLTSSMLMLKFNLGDQFEIVTVSIDPRETPEMAKAKKDMYIGRYRRAGAASGWHFLTGDQADIAKLASAVGFRYVFDPKSDQFAHASGMMVLTPEGKIAQYYYGIEYSPKDLRLALVEASQEKIGNIVDEVTLYCYHYDPTSGHYNAVTINMVRVAGVITVVLLGGFIFFSVKHEGKGNAARNSP
ncbi:MAG: SCO family protein [Acidobacteriaceae bacterium]